MLSGRIFLLVAKEHSSKKCWHVLIPTRQSFISRNVLWNSPKTVLTSSGRPHMVLYVTPTNLSAAGCPWDVLKTSIYSQSINRVLMDFFQFLLIPTVFQTFQCQRKIKAWYFLFWSYYGPERLDQNRIITGGSQDVVCRLRKTLVIFILI